jgi:hypothetical protein
VPQEVLWPTRPALLLEIGWRGEVDLLQRRAQANGNHVLADLIAHSHTGMEALPDDVHEGLLE